MNEKVNLYLLTRGQEMGSRKLYRPTLLMIINCY